VLGLRKDVQTTLPMSVKILILLVALANLWFVGSAVVLCWLNQTIRSETPGAIHVQKVTTEVHIGEIRVALSPEASWQHLLASFLLLTALTWVLNLVFE